jgi:hypothetical protein
MMTGQKLAQVGKARASRTHVERKGADHDTYGVTARENGSVVRVPESIVRHDGRYTSRRMRDLAALVGEYGGFVASLHSNLATMAGYVVSVHPEREEVREGFLSGAYLADFILRNLELLSHEAAVLSVWRDPATGHKFLNVATVVESLDLAKVSAHVHERHTVVRVADGQLCRV